jgi:exodeoxyribonuclease-5
MSSLMDAEAGITLYPEQQVGFDAVKEWWDSLEWGEPNFEKQRTLSNTDNQVFRLFGYAGTGKTTIIHSLIAALNAKVCSAAFTGKAALVMTRNGLKAQTVHSLIYKPQFPVKETVDKIKAEIAKVEADENFNMPGHEIPGNEDMSKKEALMAMREALKNAHIITFIQNPESVLLYADLLVLDECSMIGDEMADDLLAFNKPVLVLGDPGQLSPIEGTGALTMQKPDILLEKIHRQAADNPIIKMSMQAREGIKIPRGEWGTSRHISRHELSPDDVLGADQILVGKNKTRWEWNIRVRELLELNSSPYPVVGDKLICLKNNAKKQLFNGLLAYVTDKGDEYNNYIEYEILTEDGQKMKVDILRCHFDEYSAPGTVKAMPFWEKQDAEQFDFGYAITVHKSQGSQWDRVLFYDDGFFNWDLNDRKRWLYTGITRAAETLLMVS